MSELTRDAIEAHVRRYYTLVDADDVDGVLSIFAPDGVYRRPGYDPMRGHAELREFYSGERVIASGRHTINDLLVDGDKAFVRGSFEGVLKDGSKASLEFSDFFHVGVNGLVVERQSFFSVAAV